MEENKVNYSHELERELLSQIMFDLNVLEDVSLEITDDDFHFEQNRIIFSLLKELYKETLEEDKKYQHTIFKAKVNSSKYKNIVNVDYVDLIQGLAFSTTQLNTTMAKVKEYAMLRSLEKIAEKAANDARRQNKKTDEISDELLHNLNILETRKGSEKIISLQEISSEYKMRLNEEKGSSIKTGYDNLDTVLQGGLHKSDLIIIAARPGMGKTALALNLGLNVAKKNLKVLMFTLEMANDQLFVRLLSSVSKVTLNNIIEKIYLNRPEDGLKINKAIDELQKLPIYIADTASATISEIKQMSRKQAKRDGLDLIIIDYLQLITSTGKPNQIREQEVAEISRSLKILAKELQIPIVALAQLSRSVEHRSDPRPTLADIRESGSIEQDADVVMFLYRGNYYKNISHNEKADSEMMELLIKKHRHGKQGTVYLKYDLSTQTFYTPTETEEFNYEEQVRAQSALNKSSKVNDVK